MQLLLLLLASYWQIYIKNVCSYYPAHEESICATTFAKIIVFMKSVSQIITSFSVVSFIGVKLLGTRYKDHIRKLIIFSFTHMLKSAKLMVKMSLRLLNIDFWFLHEICFKMHTKMHTFFRLPHGLTTCRNVCYQRNERKTDKQRKADCRLSHQEGSIML